MNRWLPFFFLVSWLLSSCTASHKNFDPAKKYSRNQLKEDYGLLREILEKKHPSLYWYTSKDSMDMYFEQYSRSISDSMTELQFGWKVVAPLIEKIHCGHTSFGMSKAYNHWVQGKRYPGFPLNMKIWNDTMVVTSNMNRRDSVLRRGTFITSINGYRNRQLIDSLFDYMPEDGEADNVNYIRLSSNFPYFHRNIMGISRQYTVGYLDASGTEQKMTIPVFEIKKDSTKRPTRDSAVAKRPKLTRQERLRIMRSLSIDTAANTAIMTINTFSNGGLRKFFRQSFKYIRKQKIDNVVIDLRTNGGGRINLSTLLTRYVSRTPFRVVDTCYAKTQNLGRYTRYIKGKFLNNLGLFFSSRRKSDGMYHFGHWERKMYQPKKQNHYNGDLYVLINGPTFSASTLFCNVIKGQPGIQLVGEPAGGGWHGNNGVMIPDITLPNTHLRVRLPLFRLVQYNHVPKNGLGVMPDVYVGTSYEALMKGQDRKMLVVMEMIKNKKTPGTKN